jgi:hypothetical protein
MHLEEAFELLVQHRATIPESKGFRRQRGVQSPGVTLARAFAFRAVLLALPALLSACANPGTGARTEAAKAEFPPRIENMRMTVQYDLVKSAGLDGAEREKRETRAAAAITPTCVKPYTGRLAKFLDGAAEVVRTSRSIEVMASLPAQVAVLDTDFDRCLGRFGATGYGYVETPDGAQQRIPQFITQAAAPLLNAADAHEGSAEERQRNGAQMLGALATIARAGAQVNSRPDTERDGAVVSGSSTPRPPPL